MTLLHQLWNRVVFAYDFDRLTTDGKLYDYGPSGIHASFPGGANDPIRIVAGGGYYFDGNDYLTLSGTAQARFYAAAPTGTYTLLAKHAITGGILFSCFTVTGGNNYGMVILPRNSVFEHYSCIGDATTPRISVTSLTQDVAPTAFGLTVDTTPTAIRHDATCTSAWSIGAYGAIRYDATATPRISGHPSGLFPLGTGSLVYYLALIKPAVTYSELLELVRMLRTGGKPWCDRV